MLEQLANWIEKNQTACHYYSTMGMKCPGCGLQTAIIELLRGDFAESFLAYPALLPIIFTLIWSVVFFAVFKAKKGLRILITLIVIDVLLILGNWIL
jgi:Protein of unknown function (DUF2752)